MVGHRFVEELVSKNLHIDNNIIVFGEEPRSAYDRVQLSSYFNGTTANELSLVTPGYYEENSIELRIKERVTAINRETQTVTSDNGEIIPYDTLILATGSVPFVPPISGNDREGCFVYRTIEDLEAITSHAKNSKIGTVVGGGLLGLEAANALQNLGLETHVVEFAPRLMAVQINDHAGECLRNKIESLGVGIHTSKATSEITDGKNRIHKMVFADGEELETDCIVFSAGIRPRDELAKSCGLDLGERGGIAIDKHCRTSDPHIYAIGECACWNGKIFGLVAPGYHMARIVAERLDHCEETLFKGFDMSTKLKLLGVDVASIGDAQAARRGARTFAINNEIDGSYARIVVSKNLKYLWGAVLIGDCSTYDMLLQMMKNRIPLPSNPQDVILPATSEEQSLGPDALPDDATICSCHNVTKGDIVDAIKNDGIVDLPSLKSCTKVATGCGGCATLTKKILDNELEKQGIAVDTSLCEHFAYTRQELYHLIRTEQIHSFGELLEKHGTGLGCEICKPTAASIFASCWNEHLLDTDKAGLQDTNDYYLGNMQKDGTYSVVPRVPGGEITPDGLITIGTIAKKYNLYTKITGGQRVDMFGARVDQLPPIWKELIDAGFETGHAYGKSLRTVKSCVGSTWCRYGQQDSVGLAIELENRYKGLRSPHKLKMAVSGCTRECSEAQSKDLGVIATENGYNMYVCGNGGMRPRHADLFAEDLDKDTLIRYIDRFFMFYIRTADKLQRTSVWMESLDGGLEYLRKVVMHDSLNICSQLEEEMSYVIDSYECEWKATINDPEKIKRFRHFVNSDESDNNVLFVEERGQIRPATADERELQLANTSA